MLPAAPAPVTPAALVARMPMRRLGRPEDVAPLIVFLASDESRFCTGGLYTAG